jgi:hypothetical protein
LDERLIRKLGQKHVTQKIILIRLSVIYTYTEKRKVGNHNGGCGKEISLKRAEP